MTSLLPLLAFVFGSLIVAAAALLLMPKKAGVIDRRLEELMPESSAPAKDGKSFKAIVDLFKRVGEKAPRSPKELGQLRLRLVQAGFRRDEALTIFFGLRVSFALILFAVFSTAIVMRPNITLALAGLGFGYIVPGMILARLA